jgi:outer membrane protein insertion porin family
MRSTIIRIAAVLAMATLALPSALAQAAPKINSITIVHEGPAAVSDELIRANIRVKKGDAFNQNPVDDDIRNLYETGFFHNIYTKSTVSPEGVDLAYIVQGKPVLTDIYFEGNEKYKDSKLRKKLSSKIGEHYDEQKLFADTRIILELYQKSGFQQAKVEYVPSITEAAGRATVTFRIEESRKIRIKRVDFIGAQAFKEKQLRKEIKTRARWMFSWITGSGVLKEEQFEDDREKLAEFYREKGYIDFEIKDIEIEELSKKWIAIRITLSEGNQYNVGSVEVKGTSLHTEDEVKAKVRMGEGAIFTPGGLSDDIENIKDLYGIKGYIDTAVLPRKKPNIETGTMDIQYEIEENDKSYIEKIEIRGNDKTKDKVLRRELSVSPGDTFNMVAVKISKNRLLQMDYFEKVDVRPEPTDVPDRKNLVINVEEKATGNLIVGAGFSSIDALVGFVEVTQGNFDLFKPPTFTGGGQRARARAQIGTRRQDYQLTFVEPWFLERRLELEVDLFHRELDFVGQTYNEQRSGASVGLKKALFGQRNLIGRLGYTLERVAIKDVITTASQTIKDQEQALIASKFSTSIAWDTRNSGLSPSRGQRTELISTIAGGPLGGQVDTYSLELKSSHYFPGFFKGHIFELHGSGGIIDNHGSDRVPLFDRWYLGGQNTARGYRFRQIGPRDDQNEPLGGSTFWFGSAEYSVPVVERVRLAAFYDAGMVYQDAFSFSSSYEFKNNAGATVKGDSGFWNDNIGIGVRLNLPIGPLRLDYGFPLNGDGRNDKSGKFQFGAGFNRNF